MSIDPKDFRVKHGSKVDLKKWSTQNSSLYSSKEEAKDLLQEHIKELSSLQDILYADNRYSFLLIFQAMDAAGKDSAIKHVMSGVNPQGCQVYSFKHPSAEELDHDFLWRTTRCLPERGRIGIFNRSYYEEVLIVKVHPQLLEAQAIPHEFLEKKDIWSKRYCSIRDLEQHLYRNGTRIIKFFLNVSKEEQRARFLKRIDDPSKNWKFSAADIEQRKYWKEYMNAYEDCLEQTSIDQAPWYIVPADDKINTQIIISKIIIDSLRSLKMKYPSLSQEQQKELKSIRQQLIKK